MKNVKKVKNHVEFHIDLRELGKDVVCLKVSSSLQLDRVDAELVFSRVLDALIPYRDADCRRLYDGTYIVTSTSTAASYVDKLIIPSTKRDLPPFEVQVSFDGTKLFDCAFSLRQDCSQRFDYFALDTRSIRLVGDVEVAIDSDDDVEEVD